ncbi:sugar kinase [Acuticoccus kandeliae]|uniref:sugar kinase n=1 Tax=Acuticoccus kandeliae TaxID=2073160 RepID=UPI000D3E95FF|nr:sugar kinase [Acuticoccus kandeliae]
MDIVALGEPLVEFNQQHDGRWLEGFGGDTSNVAIAAARQGVKTGMISRVGTDEFGDALMGLWAREGVSSETVARDPHAPTGIYFVHHRPEGHVFSYRRAGSAAALMRPEDLPEATIRGAKVLHLSGISQAISDSAADTCFAAMRMAREAGVTVAYDTNLRLRLWPIDRARAVIHGALSLVDICLPGIDDARALTGLDSPAEIVRFYQGLGPRIVALTLGDNGALVGDGDTLHEIAPRRTKLVDASGAGDCFDGTFLASWIGDRDVGKAARYANCAASLSVEGYGAIAPIPRRADVEAALASG